MILLKNIIQEWLVKYCRQHLFSICILDVCLLTNMLSNEIECKLQNKANMVLNFKLPKSWIRLKHNWLLDEVGVDEVEGRADS